LVFTSFRTHYKHVLFLFEAISNAPLARLSKLFPRVTRLLWIIASSSCPVCEEEQVLTTLSSPFHFPPDPTMDKTLSVYVGDFVLHLLPPMADSRILRYSFSSQLLRMPLFLQQDTADLPPNRFDIDTFRAIPPSPPSIRFPLCASLSSSWPDGFR